MKLNELCPFVNDFSFFFSIFFPEVKRFADTIVLTHPRVDIVRAHEVGAGQSEGWQTGGVGGAGRQRH